MNDIVIEKLYNLIIEKNKVVNLTRITSYQDFLTLHVEDSRLGEEFLQGTNILDVGSGGGFPALMFAIDCPDKKITLVDSVNKKVMAVNDVIQNLGIKNSQAVHSRIEDLDKNKKYDCITARAVAPLNVLVELTLPYLKLNGRLVAFKASNSDEEIESAKNAIKVLGGKIEKIVDVPLNDEITRRFVLIKKIKPSPEIYPRKNNAPRLKPL